MLGFGSRPRSLRDRAVRLATDAAIIGILLKERAGDRPSRILDWRWNREIAPVVSSLIGSTAGGALAGEGQRGWWKDAGVEPHVLVVASLLRADRVTSRRPAQARR